MLILAVATFSCGEKSAGDASRTTTTYTNPINIDYTYSNVRIDKGMFYRSGADPAVVPFRDKYYLFVTRSYGYWQSDDLTDWEFVSPQNWFFEGSNAPGAWPVGDSLLIALANPSGWQNMIKKYKDLKELDQYYIDKYKERGIIE